ncbi:acylphosphatase, partial [Lutibacter sp.]|uniref:acylphosphatase n=1 Tax=Lutibacter sp. TaxID=1925666 RepID=UPI0035639216
MLKIYKITVSGQVQGVGFRPYVYALAIKFNLKGTVSNNEKGVLIVAQGFQRNIDAFYSELINFPPPVSNIQNSLIEEIESRKFENFKIIPSKKGGKLNLPLTPDFAICDDCKNEIKNQTNIRYNYPFTTCVNCGPRYAITENFPFERSNTNIDEFPMCEACTEEYTNPTNRRFHSQTNTCTICGIDLVLQNNEGTTIKTSK